MPELPETTVISQDVAALAAGRRVVRAGVFRPDVTNVEMAEFPRSRPSSSPLVQPVQVVAPAKKSPTGRLEGIVYLWCR